jgi:hypothetical protein
VVSELDSVCIFQAERAGRKNTLIYTSLVSEAACRDRQGKTECWKLCDDCLQVDNNQEDSQEDCRGSWKHSGLQSDNNRSVRRTDRQGQNDY